MIFLVATLGGFIVAAATTLVLIHLRPKGEENFWIYEPCKASVVERALIK